MKNIYLSLFATLFGFISFAQLTPQKNIFQNHPTFAPPSQRNCGFMYADSMRRANDPAVGGLVDFEIWMEDKIRNFDPNQRAAPYVIPVIVHVVHNGEAVGAGSNISQAQINSQIDVLNEDFGRYGNGSNTHPDGVDTQISFCAALVDESGNTLAEPGIDRVDRNTAGFNAPPYNTGYIDGTIKPATSWDPNRYMNVWVMELNGGLLGYAQFPDASGLAGMPGTGGAANTDGVVMGYQYYGRAPQNPFPSAYNLGRTATHEVGHWLGLRHIWGDGACGVDDFCADTPESDASNGGCPTGHVSCGTVDMIENYMDYTNDACMNIFTDDQRARMWIVMENSPRRVQLQTSTVCVPPSPDDAGISAIIEPTGTVCASSVDPVVTLTNYGSSNLTSVEIIYNVDGGPNSTFNWTGNLATFASTNVTLPTISPATGPHTFNVTTNLPNGNTDGNTTNDANSSSFTITVGNSLTLTIDTDCWGYETAWEVYDASSNLITSGGNTSIIPGGGQIGAAGDPGAYASQTTITENLCLAAGCYDFVIYDDYGDGMYGSQYGSCTIDGSYQIVEDATSNVLATIQAVNSDFGNSETNNFCVNASAPTHTATSTDVSCNGGSDGSITITASGGTAPYTYSIDGGTTFQASNTFTGLSAGTYTVLVEDANTQQSTPSSITINEPTAISLSSASTNEICGAADGTITISASGGTAPYTYSIDNGITFQASANFSGLSAGTYNLVVEDANGCQVTGTETVNATAGPSIDAVVGTDPSCNGGTDGSITITASGGTAPYTYSIDGGATTQSSNSFTGLGAGTYAIEVTDNNGCTSTSSATLNDPSAITFSSTATDEVCGANNGTITITASGGTGTLSYSIDNGVTFQASANFSGLSAGIYNLVVEDANGCQVTGTETVNSTGGPSIDAVVTTDPSCNGGTDGSITITASGGTAPYTYSIDGGATAQGSNSFTGLSAGSYAIEVTDDNGCTSTSSVTLNDPTAITFSSTTTDEACGAADGTITITASGGTGALSYSIDNGVTFQASANFSGLTAGTYNLVIEDVNGCQVSGTETVNSSSGPIINNINTVDPSCNGATDGLITIVATGGTAPYTYSIDGGVTTQGSNSFAGLGAGSYAIEVTDNNGCTSTGSATLNNPAAITFSSTATDEACGAADGTITITASGGTGALSYSIDNGITFQASANFSGLTAGTYNLVIEDANGCQVSGTETLNATAGPSIDAIVGTDPSCNGGTDGSITITASGGTAPYTYSIDGGATTQGSNSFTGLATGTYPVEVTDNNGCTSTSSATLNDPAVITFSSTATDEACGAADGTITITASGGTGALSYSIDNGVTFQASANFSGLSAGNYDLVVEDVNGCQVSGTETVNSNGGATIDNINATEPTCNGGNDGSINISASGGTNPKQYSIDGGTNFQNNPNFNGLAGGSYTIVVQDGSGCQTSLLYTLNEPAAITFSSTTTDEVCGAVDGTITITASGGTGALSYSIDNGVTFQASANFSGLTAGTYNLVIEDANGCQVNGTETVNSSSGPIINNINTVDPSCNGTTDGSITIVATGGTAPYTYSIDGGATTQGSNSFAGLGAGSYAIEVTDNNGCTSTGSATLNNPAAITFSSTATDEACGAADGTITITASGGTGALSYSIDNGITFQASANFSGLSAGTYSLVVEDANGCQVTGTEIVNSIGGPSIDAVVTTDPSCNGGTDGSITITVSGGTAPYTYSIDGGTTTQGSNSFTGLGAGTYAIEVTDNNGCTSTSSVTLNDPAAITFSSTATDEACGAADGTITITASGGTGALSYSIDNGVTFQASANFSGLSASAYNLVVEDANGCQVTGTENVNSIGGPSINAVVTTDPSCNGGTDGSITITVSGGTAPYTYSIDGGTTTQGSNSFIGLVAGTYAIEVTDTNGCNSTGSATLNDPTAITFSSTATDEACGAADGTITLTASGGTGALSYSIDNGVTFQASANFSGLTAGTYNLVVEDANGCQVTGTETVISTAGPGIDAVVGTDPSCNGGNDGSITITASGGTAPYAYSIDGGTTTQGSNSFIGLGAGTYAIEVTDNNGCTSNSSVTLNDPAAITFSSTSTDETCGAADGTITITASGGTGALSYSIDNGVTFQASGNFSGLNAGTFNLIVEDANGCQVNGTETINSLGGTTIDAISTTDVACFGGNDGSLSVTASGANPPFMYSIDGSNYQTSNSFSNLSAGNYTVSVIDANGCVNSASALIGEPSEISAIINTQNENCNAQDGSITITASGGTGALNYSIDNANTFQSNPTFNNLTSGLYIIVVEDANGCQTTIVDTIFTNDGIEIDQVVVDNISCNGSNDGQVIILVSGDTTTVSYSINGGATSQNNSQFENLTPGTYDIYVSNSNSCFDTLGVQVSEPDSLITTITVQSTNCGLNNGFAMVNVSGGTAPYNYQWDDSQSQITSAINNIEPGAYVVTTTDANGCSNSDSINIAASDSLFIEYDFFNESCTGLSDGSIATSASGGSAPYSYLWNTGDSSQNISGLTANTYMLTVVDSTGCIANAEILIETDNIDCIIIPTVISPNNDGSNDQWIIQGLDIYPNAQIEIYNRWGSLLFSSNSYQNDWDGMRNGKQLPAGVYYYVVSVDEETTYTGSLTIMR